MVSAQATRSTVERLSITAATRRHGLRHESLAVAADNGRVRSNRDHSGARYFLADELAADLLELSCGHEGCQRIALGESRRCRYHVAEVVRPGADPTPATRARMAAGKEGMRLSEEHRRRIGDAQRGPVEARTCPSCGTGFTVRASSSQRYCGKRCSAIERWATKRDRILPPLRAANAARALYASEERWCLHCGESLGMVRGSRLHSERGRFCSRVHAALWQKQAERERFADWKAEHGLRDMPEAVAEAIAANGTVGRWARRLGLGKRFARAGIPVWGLTGDEVQIVADVLARRHTPELMRRFAAREDLTALDPKDLADRYYRMFGSKAMYGRLAVALAARQGTAVGRPRELTGAQEQAIIERYARGESRRDIARSLGVGREQVRRLLAGDTKP